MGIGMTPLKTPRGIWNIDNTENKLGKITHSATLSVTTNNETRKMTFLVTDIGNEEILFGYPWLATYEPKFSWRDATIDEKILPIIVRTINPRTVGEAIKRQIVRELEDDVYRPPYQLQRTTATQLAIDAQQYTKKVEIPPEYQQFAKVFNEEESQRFPPTRV